MSRGAEDSKRMHALRGRADALIIGAGNLAADDPDLMPCRLRVVVTGSGQRVQPDARMFAPSLGGEAVVAHAASMPESKRAALRPRATLVELGAADVDVSRLLDWLGERAWLRRGSLRGRRRSQRPFLSARAIDELYLTLVPRVLGGSTLRPSWRERLRARRRAGCAAHPARPGR